MRRLPRTRTDVTPEQKERGRALARQAAEAHQEQEACSTLLNERDKAIAERDEAFRGQYSGPIIYGSEARKAARAERQRDKLAEAIRRHREWIDRRTRQADIELYAALSEQDDG